MKEQVSLSPLRPNITRWNSTFKMVERYVRIRDQIKQVEAVFNLISKAATHQRIETLLEDLRIFDSVTVALQSDDLSLADVQVLFDSVVERFPTLKTKLSASASIVHSPAFETAAVKVINGEGRLTPNERKAIKRFEIAPVQLTAGTKRKERDENDKASKTKNFAATVLSAKKKSAAQGGALLYSSLLRKLPSTSNRCERLFSQAKLVFSPQRSSLLPENFQMLMFLRANRRFWDVNTVNAVYRELRGSS